MKVRKSHRRNFLRRDAADVSIESESCRPTGVVKTCSYIVRYSLLSKQVGVNNAPATYLGDAAEWRGGVTPREIRDVY